MKIFSDAWAQAYHDSINANIDYTESGKNWTFGSIALILLYETDDSIGVWLDLHGGKCRAARSVNLAEADQNATFIIAGNEPAWKEVLGGEIQPLMAIMRGRLKLRKGSMAKLLPYAAAATHLVQSAQQIQTEF